MEFVNQLVIEAVVVEPSSIAKTKKGTRSSVVVWHSSRNTEMLLKVTCKRYDLNKAILELERGMVVTFYGEILFINRDSEYSRPFPILTIDRMRILDVDLSYGEGLLEKATLEDVNKLRTIKLPWEKQDP